MTNIRSMSTEREACGMRWVEVEAKSILNRVRGMPFAWSINPYRGCYHRCVFCYARNTHAYLERDGLSDWGTFLSVKINAAEVLRKELKRPSWRGEHVAIGTATDPYQPLEGRYRLTRRILVELARARTPAHITTRSPLVVRDVDVLGDLARVAGVTVYQLADTRCGTRTSHRTDRGAAGPTAAHDADPCKRRDPGRRRSGAGSSTPHGRISIVARRVPCRSRGRCRPRLDELLRLGDGARESYFEFLRREFPQLVAHYRATYANGYLARPAAMRLDARIADAKAGVAFKQRDAISPRPSRVQLSLL